MAIVRSCDISYATRTTQGRPNYVGPALFGLLMTKRAADYTDAGSTTVMGKSLKSPPLNVSRREIGLRLALGALRGQIVTRFLAQGLGVSFLGCVAGLGLTGVFVRLLSGMLYGVSPSDAITLGSVVLITLAVAMIASLLPAIRAARLDPMQVLREE